MILYKDNIFIPPFKTGTYSMINLIVSINDSEEDRYILLIDFLKPNVSIDTLFNNKNDTNIKIYK